LYTLFSISLKQLDFDFETQQNQKNLYFVKDKEKYNDPYIRLALENAENYDIDAVYFRRFENENRPPIPQIYIIDNTENTKDNKELAGLYLKLWNSCQIPLLYVFSNLDVKIYNFLQKPKEIQNSQDFEVSVFETIKRSNDLLNQLETEKAKIFSAKSFDNGSFWENPKYKNKFTLTNSAYESLIAELKKIRKKAIEKEIIPKDLVHRLLVVSILVKYLEERKDNEGNSVLSQPKYNGTKHDFNIFDKIAKGAKSFTDILRRKGKCVKLFDVLNEHFKGDIFNLTENEKNHLESLDLSKFANFFEGDIENDGSKTLWRLYSFNDLPIELISNIYEEFIEDKEDGVVYTPPYLVNFLLEECMPLTDSNTDFKILDPACGSGIFLVSAYKRLIYRWRSKNKWETPSENNLQQLKDLLRNNIYGVDKSEEAVKLTLFSLSLALCDMLTPKVIWENLKFDNLLNTNLFDKDFFKVINENLIKEKFDLIIGNPPFSATLTIEAKIIEKKRITEGQVKIPDRQIALLFLEQSLQFCKEETGLLCLILPSGPFLYNFNTFNFRKSIIQNYDVPQIIDFSHLSRFLFGNNGDVATLALFVTKNKPYRKNILHLTIRRTKTIKEKIYFELDKYNYYNVPYEIAISNKKENKLIWKSNLLGGGRLHYFLTRLAKLQTLSEFVNIQKGWNISEGYKTDRNKQKEIEKLKNLIDKTKLDSNDKIQIQELNRRYKKYTNIIETSKFTEIQYEKTPFNDFMPINEGFHSPHLIIKEVATNKIPVFFIPNDETCFRNTIIGISCPKKDSNKLIEIEYILNKYFRTLLMFLVGFSGRYAIARSTACLKFDIDNLPFPENEKELELNEIENILMEDVFNYQLEYRRKRTKTKIEENAIDKEIQLFSDVYCNIVNSIYKTLKFVRTIKTENFYCCFYSFGKEPSIKIPKENELENVLNSLLIKHNFSGNIRYLKIMRIYEGNTIIIIKPKQLRFWLRSIAIIDADETVVELHNQGY